MRGAILVSSITLSCVACGNDAAEEKRACHELAVSGNELQNLDRDGSGERLLALLRCDRFDDSVVFSATLRELSLVCGFAARGMLEDDLDLDEMFPPALRKNAISAGCGELLLANGERYVHPAIENHRNGTYERAKERARQEHARCQAIADAGAGDTSAAGSPSRLLELLRCEHSDAAWTLTNLTIYELSRVCGFEARYLLEEEGLELDDLFPPDSLDDATAAGCGELTRDRESLFVHPAVTTFRARISK